MKSPVAEEAAVKKVKSARHNVRPKSLALMAFGVLALGVLSAPAQTSGACITEQGTCESTLQQDGAAHGGSAAAVSLWLQDIGHIDEISPSQLKHSGMVTPTMLKSFNGDLNHAIGLCFDKSKNLWVTDFDNAVFEFTAAQLSQLMTTANPQPVVTITSSSTFTEIFGCAFDSNSNLWVVDGGGKGVHEISNAQLNAGSGDITPVINITALSTLNFPTYAVFDSPGNLWITSANNSKVAEFSASQLGSSGDKTPAVVLSDNGSGSLKDPGQAAFDRQGNLWVALFFTSQVVKFKQADLAVSGSPTPQVTLTAATVNGIGSLAGPTDLLFDGKGALWVANNGTGGNHGAIVKFLPGELRKSGSPVPRVLLQAGLTDTGQMTFGPVF